MASWADRVIGRWAGISAEGSDRLRSRTRELPRDVYSWVGLINVGTVPESRRLKDMAVELLQFLRAAIMVALILLILELVFSFLLAEVDRRLYQKVERRSRYRAPGPA